MLFHHTEYSPKLNLCRIDPIEFRRENGIINNGFLILLTITVTSK